MRSTGNLTEQKNIPPITLAANISNLIPCLTVKAPQADKYLEDTPGNIIQE